MKKKHILPLVTLLLITFSALMITSCRSKNSTNNQVEEVISTNDLSELEKFDKIGIMAGASTPKNVIQEAFEYIQELNK